MVIGIDANIVGSRLVAAAAAVGMYDGCGAGHRGTFPAHRPAYRLDALLAVQPGW